MIADLSRDIVLRWEDQDPALAPLIAEGGIDALLVKDPKPAFEQACQAVGMRVAPSAEVTIGDLDAFSKAGTAQAAFGAGQWPGISGSEPNLAGEEQGTAGATRKPWLDANGFRYDWLKALCPGKHPVLAYLPNEAAGLKPDRLVPYQTLELALAEAWIHGGNYVLAMEPRYRTALLHRKDKALAAWRSLGRTARWLKQNRALFEQPTVPRITLLVDAGEATAELANLMARDCASPALVPFDAPPAPDPQHRVILVAASPAAAPPVEIRNRILAHAAAGAIVVTDRGEGEPWWRAAELKLEREQEDREFYRCGRGTVVAYKKTIDDPGEFALDVIDLATHARRAVRLWFRPTVVASLTYAPAAGPWRGRAVLRAINYGQPLGWELMLYANGNYRKATLLRPEGPPVPLKTAKRGGSTELKLPALERVGVVVLD
jgi:hypothetical protein